MGSRYGGLKQLSGLGPSGEVLMEYSIYDALTAGFGKIVFIIRSAMEADFQEMVINRLPTSISYDVVFQELNNIPPGYLISGERTKPLGTGHALWCARHVVQNNFAVLNADDFYGRSGFEKIVRFFETAVSDGCLVGYNLNKTLSDSGSVTRGLCQQTENGQLSSIEEVDGLKENNSIIMDCAGRKLVGTELVSMNFWGFKPSIFPLLEEQFCKWLKRNCDSPKAEFILPSVMGELIRISDLKIEVLHAQEDWMGVTYLSDNELVKERLSKLANQGHYPNPLWEI